MYMIKPEFERVKERRFREILARLEMRKFNAIAKENGSPGILELAKQHAATTDLDTVNRQTTDYMKGRGFTPEQMEALIGVATAKVGNDIDVAPEQREEVIEFVMAMLRRSFFG